MHLARFLLCLWISSGAICAARAQVWEKLIFPGLTYRMEVDTSIPRVLHALRFSPMSIEVRADPELGNGTVFSGDVAKSRATVTEMVASRGAIGGVNADFFAWSGDPLGLMTIGGELVSAPRANRSAIAWGPGGAAIGRASLRATVAVSNGRPIVIDGLNEEASGDAICLNTERAGFARAKTPGAHAILELLEGGWATRTSVRARVASISDDLATAVPRGGAVLTGVGSRTGVIRDLQPGETLRIDVEALGFDWSKYPHSVGGGPVLVRDGGVRIEWAEEGFQESFALTRHPRTAAGRTREGDIWLVAIDGRQAISAGATLEETARLMLRLGCVDALNLDGGGSTTLNLFGLTMNRPSDPQERAIANGILFFGPSSGPAPGSSPTPAAFDLRLSAPDKLSLSGATTLHVVDGQGRPVEGRSILWSAAGAAWIDQGGLLKPLKEGQAAVYAWVRGRVLVAAIEIVKAPSSTFGGRRAKQGARHGL